MQHVVGENPANRHPVQPQQPAQQCVEHTQMADAKIKGGFVLKARRIQNSKIAHAPPHVREIFDYLVLNANLEDTKANGVMVERGQVKTSYEQIAEDLHWISGVVKKRYKRDTIKNAFRILRDNTAIGSTATPGGVLVTILNFDFYQDTNNYRYTAQGSTATPRKGGKKKAAKAKDAALESVEDGEFIVAKDGRKLTGKKLKNFNILWGDFDYKKGRSEAAQSYLRLLDEMEKMTKEQATALWRAVMDGARREALARPDLQASGGTPKMLQGWLTARRWEDEGKPSTAQQPRPKPSPYGKQGVVTKDDVENGAV